MASEVEGCWGVGDSLLDWILNCGIWYYLQDSVRIMLTCNTPGWCLHALCCGGSSTPKTHWNWVCESSLSSHSLSEVLAQMVKHLPTMLETRVWSLDPEDPLEKEMATHSSTLAWRIPWVEEPGGLQSMGLQRVGHNWVTSFSLSLYLKYLWKNH